MLFLAQDAPLRSPSPSPGIPRWIVPLFFVLGLSILFCQEAYVDSAALAESKLELQEERAAQGLSNEPTPVFEVEEVDDWEVRGRK